MKGDSTQILPSFKELLTSIPSEAYTFQSTNCGRTNSSPRQQPIKYSITTFNPHPSRNAVTTTTWDYKHDNPTINGGIDSEVGLPSPPCSIDLGERFTKPSPITQITTPLIEQSHYISYFQTITPYGIEPDQTELERVPPPNNLSHGLSYPTLVAPNMISYHNKMSPMSVHDQRKSYRINKPKAKVSGQLNDATIKKRHICKVCSRVFTTSGHLARHNRIHTGERKHECPWPSCNAKFSRQDNCMQHYGTHIKSKKRKSA